MRVRADIDDAHAAKTLAHELAHIECGHLIDLPAPATRRGRYEVEAESVAYIVTAAAGLDASGYTFPYVARWAGGDLATIRQAAETVIKTARTILAAVTAQPNKDAATHTAVAA